MGDEHGAELADTEDGAVAVRGSGGRRRGYGWRGTTGGVRTCCLREARVHTGIVRKAEIRTRIVRKAGIRTRLGREARVRTDSCGGREVRLDRRIGRAARSDGPRTAGLHRRRTCIDVVRSAGCRTCRARADGFGTRGTAGPCVRGHVRAAGCGGRRERGTSHGRSLPTLCARP